MGVATLAGPAILGVMAKISAPKLLENPVMKPAAKRLARKRLIDQAVSIGRAQKAIKAAKKQRRQALQTP
jgi:hypothetical protein